jgi:hypothetical protein
MGAGGEKLAQPIRCERDRARPHNADRIEAANSRRLAERRFELDRGQKSRSA